MTKFYLIEKDAIVPKDHHIIIPFCFFSFDRSKYWYWIINLREKELKEITPLPYMRTNIQSWDVNCYDWEFPIFDFLKTKQSFIKTDICFGIVNGINSFDLNENDLMYIKLLQ